MGKNKDLVSITFEKEGGQYPLFYQGDNENHYLYHNRTEEVNGSRAIVYIDEYCMCDVRDLDMTLNDFILHKGFI